jgi:tryptophan-rich sensory protein
VRQAGVLVLFILASFGAAALGGIATRWSVATWYAGLAKPSWTPPSWLFGPVWTALYAMMAVAGWQVWRCRGLAGAKAAMLLFFVQLALNAAWSWLFFGFRMPGAAFAEIVLLWSAILATTVQFWRASPLAAILFMPYLLWVSFAAALNYSIWRMNA